MKLNPFENKRVFRDRVGNARTVVRDTYVNQTARVSPPQEEPKKTETTEEDKTPTLKKPANKSKSNETKRILPPSPGK